MSKSPGDLKTLAKFMAFVLGRRPDAFGLLPDDHGYVKIKTLLQALQGDPEWGHLRQGHLNALLLSETPCPIEIQDDCVRASQRDHLPRIAAPETLPKLLYTAIRRRAHPAVHANGIRPSSAPYVMLAADLPLAEKIGRRADNTPVILTVQTTASQTAGTRFQQFGECLFLADFIPAGAFTGPPLPKAKPSAAQPSTAPERPKTPGSYFPDLGALKSKDEPGQPRQRRGEAEWQKNRRRARKEKTRRGY